jgi:hypothetical protein
MREYEDLALQPASRFEERQRDETFATKARA